jgi:hypothetical protein
MAEKFNAASYDPKSKNPYVSHQRGMHAALSVVTDKNSRKAIKEQIKTHREEFGSGGKKRPDAGGSPVAAKPKKPKPSSPIKAAK